MYILLQLYVGNDVNKLLLYDFVMCKNAGKPQFGEICVLMNQSRLRFKSALKYCQQNESKMRADSLARSMMNNDMTRFWKDVHKITSVANLAALGCVRFCFLTFLTRKIWLFEQRHKNA